MLTANERGQAALEYLVTYGWALVLIAAVVGVLVFIVSSPASGVSFSSSDPTKILVKAGTVSGTDAEIRLQNITGGGIEITGTIESGYSGCTVNESSSFPISVGAGGQIDLECTAPSDGAGTVSLEYTDYAGLPRSVTVTASGTGGVSEPQKFESNDTESTTSSSFGNTWAAQTFTPSQAHTMTSVKLTLSRLGNPGQITVSIRETTSGQPTGADRCSGTINGDALTTTNQLQEITLSAGCDLVASTKYAIVIRAPSGDASNALRWALNLGGYANGNLEWSTDGGNSWSSQAPDMLFEEWGIPS